MIFSSFYCESGKRGDAAAMEEERFVGDAATDDVIVTAVLEAELPTQGVGREDIVAREHVRARECALYIFYARIDAKHLPPATGERRIARRNGAVSRTKVQMRVRVGFLETITGTDESERSGFEQGCVGFEDAHAFQVLIC